MDEHDAPMKLPWLRRNNPSVQILLASACLFFNPGLYLAVTLLGAGGGQPSSTAMANIANGVLYGIFAFSAVGFGPVLNIVGPRYTLLFGITGYPVFQGAMWYFTDYGHLWYPIFAGAYLGLSAGALWTTATYTISAYPEERDKGIWRSVQWSLNVAGSAVGACVALGISWKSGTQSVPSTVYIVFIVLQCLSTGFAALILRPEQLIRSDGTRLAIFKQMSIKETLSITGSLFKDWRILVMIPCMFTPEMFFPFQASMNAYVFDLRTRVLNSLLNNLVQIPTALFVGWLLSNEKLGTRRKRALIAITFDAVWITGTYIAQTIWLASWKFDRSVTGPMIDCNDPAYAGAIVIYMLYAAQYGMFQNLSLWIMCTFTNDPRRSAAIGGLFVGFISSGTAVSFGVDATAQPYATENAYIFALATLCWPIMFFIAWKCITDTNYLTEEGVVAPIHVQRELGIEGKEIGAETPASDESNLPEKVA